jgi:hypothetical protein
MKRLHLLAGLVATAGLLLAALPATDAGRQTQEKWVSLFHCKDLTGWKTHPGDKARWEVKDGCIVGEGDAGHLYSERGDYENVRFKIEAKISDKGNSGQYVRADYAKGFPPGYEAQINATHGDKIRSGSLYPDFRDKYTPEEKKQMIVYDQLIKPNEWFTQEVSVNGNHIVIKLNGKTTVDFVDMKNRHTKGHLAIQQHNEGSVITVKKAEVMELPPTKK